MLAAMSDEPPIGDPVEGGAARRPGRGVRQGRYVSLSPVDPQGDAEPLWRAAHDGSPAAAQLWRYLAYGPFADAASQREWLDSIASSEDPLFLTVRGSGGPIGVVSYLNIVGPDRRIELGHIWYVPAAQRGRANTETACLLMRRAFDELGYRRVEWKCDALNARSRAAAERLGFTFEGVFRQHMIVKGRNRDTAWFSITDAEWPARRTAIETWLAADDPGSISLRDLTAAR